MNISINAVFRKDRLNSQNTASGGVSAGCTSVGYHSRLESFCNHPTSPPARKQCSVGKI